MFINLRNTVLCLVLVSLCPAAAHAGRFGHGLRALANRLQNVTQGGYGLQGDYGSQGNYYDDGCSEDSGSYSDVPAQYAPAQYVPAQYAPAQYAPAPVQYAPAPVQYAPAPVRQYPAPQYMAQSPQYSAPAPQQVAPVQYPAPAPAPQATAAPARPTAGLVIYAVEPLEGAPGQYLVRGEGFGTQTGRLMLEINGLRMGMETVSWIPNAVVVKFPNLQVPQGATVTFTAVRIDGAASQPFNPATAGAVAAR